MPYKDREKKLACQIRANRKIRVNNRTLMLDHYGRKCAKCGESIEEFLTVDHVHGGGCAERKITLGSNQRGGCGAYKKFIDAGFPDTLQTMCWNCQQEKLVTEEWVGTSTVAKTILNRAGYKRARLGALAVYGTQCACCPENRPNRLTIDHIEGGGRVKGALRGEKLYRTIVRLGRLGTYQCLCANCNHSKHIGGVCIHQRGGITSKMNIEDFRLTSEQLARFPAKVLTPEEALEEVIAEEANEEARQIAAQEEAPEEEMDKWDAWPSEDPFAGTDEALWNPDDEGLPCPG